MPRLRRLSLDVWGRPFAQTGLLFLGWILVLEGLYGITMDAGFSRAGTEVHGSSRIEWSGWFDIVLLVPGLMALSSWRYPLGARRCAALLWALYTVVAVYGFLVPDDVLGLMTFDQNAWNCATAAVLASWLLVESVE